MYDRLAKRGAREPTEPEAAAKSSSAATVVRSRQGLLAALVTTAMPEPGKAVASAASATKPTATKPNEGFTEVAAAVGKARVAAAAMPPTVAPGDEGAGHNG